MNERAWLLEDFDGRISGNQGVHPLGVGRDDVPPHRRDGFPTRWSKNRGGGQSGDVLCSGNWDEEAFDHSERFDLSRKPNPHIGFGGGGVHFSLGAHVARAQLRAIFGELLRQPPDIETGDPVYVPENFIHAIPSMPCTL